MSTIFPLELPILQIVDHAAGAVFFHIHQNGRILILAHEYTGRGRDGNPYTTLRMPFGKGIPGEPVSGTLRREVIEEVAVDPDDFEFDVVSPAPLYWEVVPDDHTGDRTHLKVMYPARYRSGTIRDYVRIDDEGSDDEETHGPLEWHEISRLLTRMWKEKAPRVHRLSVVSALMWITDHSPKAARFYHRLRHDRARDLVHFDQYHSVVNEYLTRG